LTFDKFPRSRRASAMFALAAAAASRPVAADLDHPRLW
jgi:hypothetical protein